MSFRDLRNFTEMMRALGYSRLISMENFRSPNFPLVAEILIWLVKRYDPDADIPLEIDTPTDRVLLIRSSAQFMASKANIKLNTKHLYQADGYSVRELLKATTVLYNALRANVENLESDNSDMNISFDISAKNQEIKRARLLASEITTKGATLYDLLSKEVEMREIRGTSIARQVEIIELEATLKQAVENLNSEINNIKQMKMNVSASETSLDNKIEKKRIELDRNQKRLQTLKKVRPAFMEEFERLEVELRKLYQEYLVRFRSLAYLEQQEEDAEMAEQERMQEQQANVATLDRKEHFKIIEAMLSLFLQLRSMLAESSQNPSTLREFEMLPPVQCGNTGPHFKAATKKLIEKMRQDDKFMEGPNDLFVSGDSKNEIDVSIKPPGKTSRVRIQTASRVMRKASARKVFGSMNGPAADDDDDDDDDSLDSDSDLLLDGEGSELLGSEEEDEDEVLGLNVDPRSKPIDDHSDDDF